MTVHIEAKFEPQPDITAFELAHIYMKVSGYRTDVIRFTKEQWDNLDDSLKRHFVRDV